MTFMCPQPWTVGCQHAEGAWDSQSLLQVWGRSLNSPMALYHRATGMDDLSWPEGCALQLAWQ